MNAADWIVGVSLVLLLYHWVMYPLLILLVQALTGLTRRQRVWSTAGTPRVSILIPARNEEVTIAAKIDNSLALSYPRAALEVIVVSDASSDRTDEIVRSFLGKGVRLIRAQNRIGYAAVLNELAAAAGGELLFFTDADIRLAPDALLHLADAFSDPDVGVACVRYGRVGKRGHRGEHLYDHYESWIKSSESRLGAVVGVYGAGLMIRRKCWKEMPSDTILGDSWMSATALASGARVVQAGDARAWGPAEDPAGEFRRKMRIGEGNLQAFLRRPHLYAPWTGASGWVLFSHKGFRLLLPWLMLAMLLGSAIGAPNSARHLVGFIAQSSIWLTCPILLLPGTDRLRQFLLPQYLLLMSLALGLGSITHLLGRGCPSWERTPRTEN